MRAALTISAMLLLLGAVIAVGLGFRNAHGHPLVRRATLELADWPAGAKPVRAALISDFHLGNVSTDPARLARVVGQVNARHPDIVLIAGDFVAGYSASDARRDTRPLTAALGQLHPRLGVVAVLGNHDNESDPRAVAAALSAARIAVVENSAVRRGPLIIGGAGDTVSGHARLGGTLNAMRRLQAQAPGAVVYLSHSPDIVQWLPPGPALLLAGHTHCGQIVLPLLGSFGPVSRLHGNRYRCGMIREGQRITIVTGGIGTSDLPFRFGAPPDWWLLTLKGPG